MTRNRARVSYLGRHSFGTRMEPARAELCDFQKTGVPREGRVEKEADGGRVRGLDAGAGLELSARHAATEPFFPSLGRT